MLNTTIKITSETKGQRLDKFLADFDAARSRAVWQKNIKNEEVLVNGKTAFTNYILKEKDTITILPEKKKEVREIKIPDIGIIYEDRNIIVIDKPAGVLSHKALTSDAPTVTAFLEKHYPPIKKIGEAEQKSGLVHRLDKDTSGILIAAKTQDAFDFLKDKFKKREIQKIYIALVYGKVEPEKGEINLAIGRNPKMPCRQTVIRNPENSGIKSREARTLYKTIKNYNSYSLLSIELKTGRMHQIRVHMKAIGNPVTGDQKYADKKLLKASPDLTRQFLHAAELKITLPGEKERTFKSELPQDLQAFLQKLSELD